MSKSVDMVASGLHITQAQAINGLVETGITATTSATQANARVMRGQLAVVSTAASGSGIRLPGDMEVGDTVEVKNLGANAVLVFPPRATDVINALSAGAGLSVAAAARVFIRRTAEGNYIS